MKKQISDEQIDRLLKTLIDDASADAEQINEIVDSPTLWWGVQRQIKTQNKKGWLPWPPTPKFLRPLMIGIPALACLVISVYFFQSVPPDHVAHVMPADEQQTLVAPVGATDEKSTGIAFDAKTERITARTPGRALRAASRYTRTDRPKTHLPVKAAEANTTSAEIKSDFIALSYARSPESGQIVRVRVPSSMMVTLGLVTTVEKPSALVDAEVLVGDDGMTHSIRFIR